MNRQLRITAVRLRVSDALVEGAGDVAQNAAPFLIKPQILEVRSAPLSALRVRLRSSAGLIRCTAPTRMDLPMRGHVLLRTQLGVRPAVGKPSSLAEQLGLACMPLGNR